MNRSEQIKFRDAIANFALDYAREHSYSWRDALIASAVAMRLLAELLSYEELYK